MALVDLLGSVDAPAAARRTLQDLADTGATDPATGLCTWRALRQRLERGRTDAPVCGAFVVVSGDATALDALLRRVGEELRARLPRGSEVARLDEQDLLLVVPGHAAGMVDPVALVAEVAGLLADERPDPSRSVECRPLAPTTAGALPGRVDQARAGLPVGGPAAAFAPPAVDPSDVLAGIERAEFDLVYQPVVDPDGGLVAVEALLRWDRPAGMVLPAEFLPSLERDGTDLELGRWVLDRALTDAARWSGGPLDGVPVVVNMSPTQLAAPDLADRVEAGLGRTRGPGVVLEMAPRPDEGDLRGLLAVLAELRDAGARLSLDRVDRGAISAGLLSALPLVDTVKLDRSVVADLDGTGRATAAALRILAERVGTALGATGVETAAQLRGLRELGVEVVQGYRFCPPVPVTDLADRVRRLGPAGRPDRSADPLPAFAPAEDDVEDPPTD